jgi:hypothetical protein
VTLISGDFNLIYKVEDKNNLQLDKRLMETFKAAIDELELREISLHERKFTWSSNPNSQAETTNKDRESLLHDGLGGNVTQCPLAGLGVDCFRPLPTYSSGGNRKGQIQRLQV